MRNPFAKVIVASLVVLTLWSAVAQAQGRGGRGGAAGVYRRVLLPPVFPRCPIQLALLPSRI